MRVGVDNSMCQGHARCEAVSDFFVLDDDGYSAIGPSREVPPGLEQVVRDGVDACPEAALHVIEETESGVG